MVSIYYILLIVYVFCASYRVLLLFWVFFQNLFKILYTTRSSMTEHKGRWDPRCPCSQPQWEQVTSCQCFQKLGFGVRQLQMFTFLLRECREAHDSSTSLSPCLLLYAAMFLHSGALQKLQSNSRETLRAAKKVAWFLFLPYWFCCSAKLIMKGSINPTIK